MGSYRIFRALGIDVYVHWTWIIVAAFQMQSVGERYHRPVWGVWEVLFLFGIVLLHEYGHALAARSIGGRAEKIVLWPLGGIAFVQVPPRPGAVLWSIAAGPLVNVALLPVTIYLAAAAGVDFGSVRQSYDLREFLFAVAFINAAMLFFNMLPIYPLDGGQILQALLWFVLGRARSLTIAASIGLVCAAAGGLLALATLPRHGNYMLLLIAVFAAFQSWQGLKIARALALRDNVTVIDPRERTV